MDKQLFTKAVNSLGVVFFPAFDWAISPTHPEREERLLYTRDQLKEEGIFDIEGITEYRPEFCSYADIERVHFCLPSIQAVTTDSHLASAGGAITTAIVSALTRIPVRADVAMTGEITLRGEILEIGGLKEKLLAALRGGIKKVMIPEDNVKDLAEIPQNVKDGLEIVPVRWIEQVLEQALVRMPEPLPKEDMAESLAAVPAEQPGLPEIVAH